MIFFESRLASLELPVVYRAYFINSCLNKNKTALICFRYLFKVRKDCHLLKPLISKIPAIMYLKCAWICWRRVLLTHLITCNIFYTIAPPLKKHMEGGGATHPVTTGKQFLQ